jgi:hypothetical protein
MTESDDTHTAMPKMNFLTEEVKLPPLNVVYSHSSLR